MSELETNSDPLGRSVPVDWEALEDAFENNAPEVHSYLQIHSGEVLRVVDGVADPEMHSRIVVDANYLRIESVSSREQYRWMERFIQMVETEPLRESLAQAIDGKGAFRRFKDVLMTHAGERERWFTFRSERLRVFMEAWLTAHAIVAVPRQEWKPEEPAETDGPPVVPAPAARRARSAEVVRKALKEVTDSLGSRDLDKILAFAEFVKARRISRSEELGEASALGLASPIAEAGESHDQAPNSEPRMVMTVARS
jgi:Uncharacterised protein family (UPF0158)